MKPTYEGNRPLFMMACFSIIDFLMSKNTIPFIKKLENWINFGKWNKWADKTKALVSSMFDSCLGEHPEYNALFPEGFKKVKC